MKVKYFSGTTEIFSITSMDNKQFSASFPGVRGRKYDGYSMLVGFDAEADISDRMRRIGAKPVTRVIYRKSNPSNHKCDARCRNAKGHNCECSCGGQFHGAGG